MQQLLYDINMKLFVQVDRTLEVSQKNIFHYTVNGEVYMMNPQDFR